MLQTYLIPTLFDQIEFIRLEILKHLALAARPLYFNTLSADSLADAEVGAQIALRKVAAAAGNFPNLCQASSHDAKARAHRIVIAPGANQFEIEKMIAAVTAVVQQKRRISIVCHQYVHTAGVIEVGKSYAAAHVGRLEPGTGRLRCLHELAIAFIVKQRIELLEVNLGGSLLYLRINVTVGDEQVQPAIVIVIEEASAETKHPPGGARYPRPIADLVKRAFSIVVPKVIGVVLEISDEQI